MGCSESATASVQYGAAQDDFHIDLFFMLKAGIVRTLLKVYLSLNEWMQLN